MSLRYADMVVDEPDLEELGKRYSALLNQLSASDCEPEAIIATWDGLRRQTATWQNLTELKFNQDTTNPDSISRQQKCDEIAPQLTELDISIKSALLDGPHRDRLEKTIGKQAISLWTSQRMAFAAEIKEDLVTESKLVSDYNALLSAAELSFDGQTFNHEGIDQFRFHTDRIKRHQSMTVKWRWFDDHSEQLDELFDRLVSVRDSMATRLGFDNYVGMGYQRMCRVDYDAGDVDFYRNEVLQSVVPFCVEQMRQRKQTLGIEKTMIWDESVHGPGGNPRPNGDQNWMVDRAREMFDAMSPSLGRFFRLMIDHDLMDLDNRPGKGGGGFCTDFPQYGLPFIFANFNGTADDVRVFTHEMGHAFQGYCSRQQILYDYVWPTYESCEIHSMGLEFLTFPHMHRFFGSGGDRFCREHLVDSMMFFPYGVAVDHFQHLVYQTPSASPADRMSMWKEVESKYLPWRDSGDIPYLDKGGRWQLQRHIYMYPFYYIDYTLALACALQLWHLSQQDYDQTLETYEDLCLRGGEASFRELAASANLKTPFEEGLLPMIVQTATQFLTTSGK